MGHHRTAVLAGRILRKASPPASEFEDTVALAKLQLPADQLQFLFLCLRQCMHPLPVGAGVLHVRVQHLFVKVVVQIVVLLRHSLGELFILHIEEARLDCIDNETLIDDVLVELGHMNL